MQHIENDNDNNNGNKVTTTLAIKPSRDLIYGIIAGVTCTVIYNPIDKAIQRSQLNKTPLFISDNFSRPYQGAVQASMQRMIFGTAYYWMQGYFRSEVAPRLKHEYGASDHWTYFITGICAGSLHGFASNPSSLIKAQTWLDQSNTFINRTKAFYNTNGVSALFRGSMTNVFASGLYGGLYEVTRHSLRHAVKHQPEYSGLIHSGIRFACDLTAAFACTAIVSPLTYIRNVQYAVAPQMKSKSLVDVTKDIHAEFKSQRASTVSRLGVFAVRIRMIEMATRTAFNMATGQVIVDSLRAMKH